MKRSEVRPLSRFLFVCMASTLVLISCRKPPEADFMADPVSPKVGDNVKLTDMSSNSPDSWEWELTPNQFEYLEGTSSGSQVPRVRFSEAGPVTVKLTVSNSDGTDTETKEDYITVLNDFSPVVMVHSQGLENNLLGDNADREVRVYLPPDYFENTSRHYPVIYLLHGFYGDHNTWYNENPDIVEINIEESLNTLIGEGVIEPMIVAAPNSSNKYFGSKYTNSSTAGMWEDFITRDVIQYMDSHFRTLPDRVSRGIAGTSMGGYGAVVLAMKHPELFGALYGQSSSDLCFEDIYFDFMKQDLVTASQLQTFNHSDLFIYGMAVASCVASAPAFAPDPDDSRFYGDFPVNANGDRIDSTWERWLEHDPYTMLPAYKDHLKQIHAILLDCGDTDDLLPSNEKFSQALTGQGISHIFEEFTGGHLDRCQERYVIAGFPFFSDHLVHE